MDKFKEIKIIDYIITFILTMPLVVLVYNLLYKICNYSNLKDFYVGEAIFYDHNKYLDLGIFFIYLLLFLIILSLVTKLTKNIKIKKDETISNSSFSILDKLKKYQYSFLFGFLFLHPLDYHFYPLIIVLSIIFMIVGFIDIKKRNNETFSPIAIAGLLFICYYLTHPYTSSIFILSEDHHLGEKFATYFLHQKFGLKYYQDIMLVHGFMDILPSWLGDFFFKETTIYSSYLGLHLLDYLIFISTIIIFLFTFTNGFIFIAPLLLLEPHFVYLYFVSYIFLITNKITNKHLLWLIIYIILTYLFIQNWTTFGTFCFISSFPFAIYMFVKLLKQSKNRIKDISIIVLLIVSIYYFNQELITGYLEQAQYYIKGNLLSFGNGFPPFEKNFNYYINAFIRLFALFFAPYIIVEIIKEFTNTTKNKNYIFLLVFFILFLFSSISYALGRIDGTVFARIYIISFAYITIVIPYLIYKSNPLSKRAFTINKIILITVAFITIINLLFGNNKYIYNYNTEHTNNIGRYELNYPKQEKIRKINNTVQKYVKENEIFFDLSNCGMNYMYTSKNMPVMYISYYNSISTKQAKASLKNLIETPPKLVLLGTYDYDRKIKYHYFDNVKQTLRINSIYRWLFLCGKYQLVIENDCIFLLYTNEKQVQYNELQLQLLDAIMSVNNLMFLPEVWGNSTETLELEQEEIKHTISQNGDTLKITFDKPINGKSIQLIMIEPKEDIKELVIYEMGINSTNSKQYFFSKRNGKLLIPFDNLVSFMLNKEINEIEIKSSIPIDVERKITFYKRK